MKTIKNKFEVNAREFGDKYFDVRLRSLDSKKEIKGHKVYLAAVSPRLEELFDENNLSSSDEPIMVRNIGFVVLSAIVRFAYTGKIDLAEQSPEFVEDFKDGMNMLRITLCDKAEKKIAEELKELKKLSELKRLKETKEKELREMQLSEAKLTCTKSEKRHHSGSEGNDELNNTKQKKGCPNAGRDDGLTESYRQRNLSKERESEHSTSSERNITSDQVKSEQDDPHQGSAFDLRGLLVNKQMIKQIRHSVEQNQRNAGKGGDGCDDEAKHERRWHVEPQYREDMYAFDPNDPVANPAWSSDLQVMIGPLPSHLSYKDLEHAVWSIGDIQRLYLQWNNKFKPRFLEPNEVRFAYVVFKELAAARRLLQEERCIEVAGEHYGVTRMR